MGYRALLRGALPGGNVGCQLQPRGPELQVVGLRCAGNEVDARGDPFEQRRPRCASAEPRDGGTRDARMLRLPARDEAPLILRDLAQAMKCRTVRHYCILYRK